MFILFVFFVLAYMVGVGTIFLGIIEEDINTILIGLASVMSGALLHAINIALVYLETIKTNVQKIAENRGPDADQN